MKKRGFVFYDGPSMIDGKRIIGVCITESSNRKTGDMMQTYILRRSYSPIQVINSGGDVSICGQCPHRGVINSKNGRRSNKGRTCYVRVEQGPTQVWKSFHRGNYGDKLDVSLIQGRKLRLGSYGDPTAIPLEVWQPMIDACPFRTGYTHQRETCDQRWKEYLMASTESDAGSKRAIQMGWRFFQVILDNTKRDGTIICPATREVNKLQCHQCGACNGCGSNPNRVSVVIQGHGGVGKIHQLSHVVS